MNNLKILLVADCEEKTLWGNWTADMAAKLSEVDLILSAGDLNPSYLEFLIDGLNVPLTYVPGNHDIGYVSNPPKRCINADGRIVNLNLRNNDENQSVKIVGLGGSMRYKDGPYQYSEEEQKSRVEKLLCNLDADSMGGNACINILLTHSPCRGFGDMDDLPHRGFECFNALLETWKPNIHCYGHVHKDYIGQSLKESGYIRIIKHPSGTHLINGYGYQFIQI